MRKLVLASAIAGVLAACGGDTDAGCREGQTLACVCADGAEGTRSCGVAACVCEPGAGPVPILAGRAPAPDAVEPAPSERAVELPGPADPGCLSAEPRSLAFAVEEPGCETAEATVTVTNGCGVPVRLGEVSVDGAGFLVAGEPPRPAWLAPGDQLPVVVGYRPATPGSHEAALTLGLAGRDPLAIALAGTAAEGTFVTDHFVTAPRPQLDVLFVIDNGRSMADDADLLAANLRPFLSFLLARDLDFHVGVTTTGLAPGGDCPGGVGGGEDGRLVPVIGEGPRILDRDTPDLEAAWAGLLAVGACRDGPNQPLEAAVRALTPPVADAADDPRHPEAEDGNAGFLRPEARLAVVVITDRGDASPESPAFYYNALLGLKGYRNPHLLEVHAITGDPGTGCAGADGRSAEPGDRLHAVVAETGGGVFESICASGWEQALRDMTGGVYFAFPTVYSLGAVPRDLNGDGVILDADGELELSLDGTLTPSRTEQGHEVWEYWADLNAIHFGPLATPEPETAIDVRYRAACP